VVGEPSAGPPAEHPQAPDIRPSRVSGCTSLKQVVAAFERALIEVALARSQGCQRAAAEALGILPTTLHQKMRRLGIPTARAHRYRMTTETVAEIVELVEGLAARAAELQDRSPSPGESGPPARPELRPFPWM